MRNLIKPFLLISSTLCLFIPARAQTTDSLLNELNKAISRNNVYVNQKLALIRQIKKQIPTANTPWQKYSVYNSLYEQ
jgi:hypothetical protein